MAELVDAHVSGACAARRAGSIPVLGTIPIEDSAGGVIHSRHLFFVYAGLEWRLYGLTR